MVATNEADAVPDRMMAFRYRNSRGEVRARRVVRYVESGAYISGWDELVGGMRQFRKDRIVEYLDGAEAALLEPYPAPPPRVHRSTPPDRRPQVCFTGFPSVQRTALERRADAGGLRVVKSVTVGLVFLCTGPNAGPKKIERSRAQGVYIVRESELLEMLETGELPDHAVDEVV